MLRLTAQSEAILSAYNDSMQLSERDTQQSPSSGFILNCSTTIFKRRHTFFYIYNILYEAGLYKYNLNRLFALKNGIFYRQAYTSHKDFLRETFKTR
jgi:hypothetical protein